jgi:hypothetical protein
VNPGVAGVAADRGAHGLRVRAAQTTCAGM